VSRHTGDRSVPGGRWLGQRRDRVVDVACRGSGERWRGRRRGALVRRLRSNLRLLGGLRRCGGTPGADGVGVDQTRHRASVGLPQADPVTGLGRGVRLDLYYVENWSPALDLVILITTAKAVISGRGAY
jgi:hypothetical protein